MRRSLRIASRAGIFDGRTNERTVCLSVANSARTIGHALRSMKDICVRTASMADIPAIRDCNLQSLPENYEDWLYHMHLCDWPQLALVATVADSGMKWTPSPRQFVWGDSDSACPTSEHSRVVGYILGRPTLLSALTNVPGKHDESSKVPPQMDRMVAQLFSVAVLPEFRNLGIGRALMSMFHRNAREKFDLFESALHVRPSNIEAVRLYEHHSGYHLFKRLPCYYSDGEDALLLLRSI